MVFSPKSIILDPDIDISWLVFEILIFNLLSLEYIIASHRSCFHHHRPIILCITLPGKMAWRFQHKVSQNSRRRNQETRQNGGSRMANEKYCPHQTIPDIFNHFNPFIFVGRGVCFCPISNNVLITTLERVMNSNL